MHKNLDMVGNYAVIFTSKLNSESDGYVEMATKMEQLARKQKGFIGIESTRSEIGITVSYWENPEAIQNWKQQLEHLKAQKKGQSKWYNWYKVYVCKIDRAYEFIAE